MTYVKDIYFVRHGSLPEAWNDTYVGQDDVPLSCDGIRECEATGKFLNAIPFDAAYGGTLRRVSETITAVQRFATMMPEIQRDERLNEIDFGDWGLQKFQDIALRDPEGYATWSLGYYGYAFPHGESIAHFAERTRAFLSDVLSSEAKTIVVFSHGGVIMALIADLVGNHRDNAFNLWVERGGVARVRVRDDGTARLVLLCKPAELFA